MTHVHQNADVKDSDPHFKINPDNRSIVNESGKSILIQGDHNSERFTFEMPRMIEGHDMSLCDTVEIHYLNVGPSKDYTQAGIYEVDDMEVKAASDHTVTFSWLISNNATRYVGSLSFVVHFACTDAGETKYSWDTEIYAGVTVNSTIHNSEAVVLEYADVLEAWKARLFGINNTGLSDVEQAVEEAVDEIRDEGKKILDEMTLKGDATAAQSWAVGGTGTRPGEDTDNSRYWARESAKSAIEAKAAAESIGESKVEDTHDISGQGPGAEMVLQSFLDIVGNYIQRAHTTVKIKLTAAGWSGSAAPFTQTVNSAEITEKDNPIMVSLLPDDANLDTRKAYNKAFAIVASGTGVTSDGAVTFKVNKKPAIDLEVGLTYLRGDN